MVKKHRFVGKDEVVAHIYETNNYGKFKFVAENRGRKETDGISAKRMELLQWLKDNNKWIPEKSTVYVNEDGLIVEGRHNFELAVRNKLPVRYIIMEDVRFNDGMSLQELLEHILWINTIDTSWGKAEIFSAACQGKFKVALAIQSLLRIYKDAFKWTDVWALLTHEEDYFAHAAYSKFISMSEFRNNDLYKEATHENFRAEINYLLKLMELFSGTENKRMWIRAVYSILNKANEIIDRKAFRKCVLKLDHDKIVRLNVQDLKGCVRILTEHYNLSQQRAGIESSIKHGAVNKEIEVKTPKRVRRKQQLMAAAA
jgi:hypothetical protein